MAIGSSITASDTYSLGIGQIITSSGWGSTVIGHTSKALGTTSLALGYKANATTTNSVAIGSLLQSSGINSVALGYNISCTKANSVCLGTQFTGIGTGNPTHALNVVGDGNFTGNLIVEGNTTSNYFIGDGSLLYNVNITGLVDEVWNYTDGEIFKTNLSAHVGIGTDNPPQELSVTVTDGSVAEFRSTAGN